MNIRNVMCGILFATLLLGLAMAEDYDPSITTISSGMCELYGMVNSLLAVVVFVLIVVAAIIYAAGQVMGAETRARASVWATSMIIGAVIGIIIYVLVPIILSTMMGGLDIDTVCTGQEAFGTVPSE